MEAGSFRRVIGGARRGGRASAARVVSVAVSVVAWLGVWLVGCACLHALSACGTRPGSPERSADAAGARPAGDSSTAAPGRQEVPRACAERTTESKALGAACACHEECGSGACVDGVCCSSACRETCRACNLPGWIGTCSPIPDGAPPVVRGQCQVQPVGTCGLDGLCDGGGGCRVYPDGTVCHPGTCDGAVLKGTFLCAAGSCKGGPEVVCAPYACDLAEAACFSRCASDAHCRGSRCVDGSCGKKPPGGACAADAECESGFCADGVCCNLACTGACVACNLPGRLGQCSPVAAGAADPHGLCAREPPESCGSSGRCDGQGGCAKHASGTICKAASCSGGSQVPASACDGDGACVRGAPVTCAPFLCQGGACKLSCASNAECAPPSSCVGGSCGKRPLGAQCAAGTQCESGLCADGVCCDSACSGPCSFCAFPSALGRCVAVPEGLPDPRVALGIADPSMICRDQGPGSCGTNGRCDGQRGCQRYANGTVCKPESCDPGTHRWTQQSVCSGGACASPAARSCAPYKCNGPRCGRACAANEQCLAPNTCRGTSCGTLPQGSLCSKGEQCGSGVCAQGVCCNTACAGSCSSCAVPGKVGTCSPVAAGGEDPAGTCVDQGRSSCGTDGRCDGEGGCRTYAAGTECAPQRCALGTKTERSTCNGAGRCTAGGATKCEPYVCNPQGTDCFGSCTGSGAARPECAPEATCHDGRCERAKERGAPCQDRAECEGGLSCEDGVCCTGPCGPCRSCALPGTKGICAPLPAPSGCGGCPSDGGCPSIPAPAPDGAAPDAPAREAGARPAGV